MITMCVPIKNENGDVIGTVQRNYSLAALERCFSYIIFMHGLTAFFTRGIRYEE